jgi:hypothetical protein
MIDWPVIGYTVLFGLLLAAPFLVWYYKKVKIMAKDKAKQWKKRMREKVK